VRLGGAQPFSERQAEVSVCSPASQEIVGIVVFKSDLPCGMEVSH